VLIIVAGLVGVIGGASSVASLSSSPPPLHGAGGVDIASLAVLAGAAGGISSNAVTSGSANPGKVGIAQDMAGLEQAMTPNPGMVHSTPQLSRLDPLMLFLYFQSISTNGLLSLDYPDIYRAFMVNFAWANFILPICPFRCAAWLLRKCNLSSDSCMYSVPQQCWN
jgi:hypothetical protein